MNDETPVIRTSSTSGEPSQQPDAGRRSCAEEEAQQGRRPRRRAAAIEARIGHKFADPALLATAFTHVSALKPATHIAPTAISAWNFSATTCSG